MISSDGTLGPGTVDASLVSELSLEQVLRSLGLDRAATLLPDLQKKAIARQGPPSTLLDSLMREELRAKAERRAESAMKRSGIFPRTTLDTYDFEYPESIDRDLVMKASSLEFVRQKSNVVLVGPPGVGKTHLANALGEIACLRGPRFVSCSPPTSSMTSSRVKPGAPSAGESARGRDHIC